MFLRIGHRGAAGHVSENTIESIQQALDLGVDMIELDVRRCRSGEVIVFHDDATRRLTGVDSSIEAMSIDEIRQLRINNQEKIPSLSAVLDFVNRQTKINIELKGRRTAGPTLKILEEVINQRNWREDDFLLTSFSPEELKICRSRAPDIPRGLLLTELASDWPDKLKELAATYLLLPDEQIRLENVQQVHQAGGQVIAWTVNDPTMIKRLKKWQIDGIISDWPERLA